MRAKELSLIAILGPTASGKSELAVKLARKFKGEIVSADSRQIYKGLDVGTGKVDGRWRMADGKRQVFVYKGVPHYLIDFANPKKQFSVDDFRRKVNEAIADIVRRGKIPFLVGGTGFYIDAVARGIQYPNVPPNPKLRKQLAKKSATELFDILKKLEPARAKTIERQNPRRMIRAIEIARAGKFAKPKLPEPPYRTLFMGIIRTPNELRRRILLAVKNRVRKGLVREASRLAKSGISKKRLVLLGIDYKLAFDFLDNKIGVSELLKKLEIANWHYAKRQRTWFRRYKDIRWVTGDRQAEELAKEFLKN